MVVGVLVALALLGGCATSAQQEPATSEDFLEITDCRELELLAAAEVDRIADATDQPTIDEARDRFIRIVAHRDSVC